LAHGLNNKQIHERPSIFLRPTDTAFIRILYPILVSA